MNLPEQVQLVLTDANKMAVRVMDVATAQTCVQQYALQSLLHPNFKKMLLLMPSRQPSQLCGAAGRMKSQSFSSKL
jgi:hypothetical protein